MMQIRIAEAQDADAICAIVRQSITHLCNLDHHEDKDILKTWLENKTPATFKLWINSPNQHFFVAEEQGNIIGVGAVTLTGEITLNYVAPEARFQGISKALLSTLEAFLSDKGFKQCTLTSTKTAHGFYQSAGYEDKGEPTLWMKLKGYPMRKGLRSTS